MLVIFLILLYLLGWYILYNFLVRHSLMSAGEDDDFFYAYCAVAGLFSWIGIAFTLLVLAIELCAQPSARLLRWLVWKK